MSRAEQARATRRRVIETASRLFTVEGYSATTMDRIAEQAGVAVQTVYYTFGTKGQLLCEAMEFTAAGQHDPTPVVERRWMIEALTTSSARRSLSLIVEHGIDIYERAAPLWPAVNAAALSDPAVYRYWTGVTAGRRVGMARLVARIGELDGLRTGLDADRATDIMFVLNGHSTFQSLVIEAGWALPTFKAWLYSTLVQQLLTPGDPDPSATVDLSFAREVNRWLSPGVPPA